MALQITKIQNWLLLSIRSRMDAFNFEEVATEIKELVDQGNQNLILDLSNTKFLSLKSIKFLSEVAVSLNQREGRLALLGLSQKLKRQLHTFASFDGMEFYRSLEEWRSHQSIDSPVEAGA